MLPVDDFKAVVDALVDIPFKAQKLHLQLFMHLAMFSRTGRVASDQPEETGQEEELQKLGCSSAHLV